MKKIKQILLAIIVSTIAVSCQKDDSDIDQEPLKKEAISGKWNVSGASEYKSFEFNESGNYIVVENKVKQSVRSTTFDDPSTDDKVCFGTYEIIDNKTIRLTGFGTIKISSLKNNSIAFSLLFDSDPDNEILMNAMKEQEMQNTSKTELLCRTWKTYTLNGEKVAGTVNEITVVFSRAGTYLFNSPDEGTVLARWRWKDEKEGLLQYSDIDSNPPEWNENELQIIKITATDFTFIEKFDLEVDELWELKAVRNS